MQICIPRIALPSQNDDSHTDLYLEVVVGGAEGVHGKQARQDVEALDTCSRLMRRRHHPLGQPWPAKLDFEAMLAWPLAAHMGKKTWWCGFRIGGRRGWHMATALGPCIGGALPSAHERDDNPAEAVGQTLIVARDDTTGGVFQHTTSTQLIAMVIAKLSNM